MKRKLNLLFKIICGVLAANTVFVFIVGGVIYGVGLRRHAPFHAEISGNESWLEKEGTDLYLESADGIRLHGYYKENPEVRSRLAVICHGHSGDGAGMSGYARRFYNLGYSIFVPDARAHGLSEGNLIGMGYLERRDIIGWINLITKDKPDAEVVLFGVSMGGSTVLFTSGETDLPQSVKAVVSDCAYTDVYNELGSAIRYTLPWVPSFPIVDCAGVICILSGGYSLRKASCVDAVKRSTTPTLFIHGSADNYVPFDMLDVLYEGCGAEKERLVVAGADHASSAGTDGELYWSTVEGFLGKYIKAD